MEGVAGFSGKLLDKSENPILTSLALAIAVEVWEIAFLPAEKSLG